MGTPFATNIAQAGFDLMVYDLRPEPLEELRKLGAKIGASPRQVAEHAEVIHIAVPHEPEVEAVLAGEDGLLEGAKPGSVFAIHSSLHPDNMKRIASEVEARGITVLDAQMSGGARGVMGHTLCFMVGGASEALERCRPTLETTGKDIFLMGPVGTGALTKIAQNTVTAMHLAVATEGYGFAKAAGIDLEMFQEVIRASAAQSHVADFWLTQWAPRNVRWQYYDVLENALQIGRQIDAPLPTAALCQQLLATILRNPE
jgi:3-hydroxyisobutyrate dehydrogenase-like beta-hydroxyacid dehydrogenase